MEKIMVKKVESKSEEPKCRGTTAKGSGCINKQKYGEYCGMHVLCSAILANNENCSKRATKLTEVVPYLCSKHQDLPCSAFLPNGTQCSFTATDLSAFPYLCYEHFIQGFRKDMESENMENNIEEIVVKAKPTHEESPSTCPPNTKKVSSTSFLCKGIKCNGKPCHYKANNSRGFCKLHLKQDTWFYERELMFKAVSNNKSNSRVNISHEKVDEFNEYALEGGHFVLSRHSKSILSRFKKMVSGANIKKIEVELTVYGAGVIFEYPDPEDGRSFFELWLMHEIEASHDGNILNICLGKGTKKQKVETFICHGCEASDIVHYLQDVQACQPKESENENEKEIEEGIAEGNLLALKKRLFEELTVASIDTTETESDNLDNIPAQPKNTNERAMSSSCSQVYPWSSWLERIAAAAEDKRRDVLTGQTGGSLRKSFGLVYPDELQAEGNIKYLEKLLSSLFPKKKVPVLSNTSPSWMTSLIQKDRDGCYWWGRARNARTGRRIGSEEDLSAFRSRLSLAISNVQDDTVLINHSNNSSTKSLGQSIRRAPSICAICTENYGSTDHGNLSDHTGPHYEERESKVPENLYAKEIAQETDAIAEVVESSPNLEPEPFAALSDDDVPYRKWIDEIKERVEAKIAEISDPLEKKHERTTGLIKELGLDKKDRLLCALNDRRVPEGGSYCYYWDNNCKKYPIGNKKHLEMFAVEMGGSDRDRDKNGLLAKQYANEKDASVTRGTMTAHIEKKRSGWDTNLVDGCWEKRRTGKIYDAWKKAFGSVPAFVDDTIGAKDDKTFKCKFRVDMYGNVISYSKAGEVNQEVQHKAVCSFEIDHVMPWSRGGLSFAKNNRSRVIDNVECIAWMANRRKSDKFLHGARYTHGWTTNSGCSVKESLNNGISVKQFIALWKYVKLQTDKDVKSNVTKREKRVFWETQFGKDLMRSLLKSNPLQNSWKFLSRYLQDSSMNPDTYGENGEEIVGPKLYWLLVMNCYAPDMEQREEMLKTLNPLSDSYDSEIDEDESF
jgi:hypothetical protein